MMIFPTSSGMHTLYVTTKTKPDVIHMLIDEGHLDPDDPLRPIIEAFINQTNANEIQIRSRIRLVFL